MRTPNMQYVGIFAKVSLLFSPLSVSQKKNPFPHFTLKFDKEADT